MSTDFASPTPMPTLADLAADLAAGRTSSAALTEAVLSRMAAAGGEGARTFTLVLAEPARAAARASDALRSAGLARSPLEGIPISVKDVFDITGHVTTAGMGAAQAATLPVARADAAIVAALRVAGAVIVGRTNMTELAFSGLGLNPHWGTPRNPWDRGVGRIPGGSSSGAAISVTDGMAAAAIGTDTGGSVRIPAAWCGLVGFKPTAARVSMAGMVHLAEDLDSIGPIGRSVACCALLDAVLSGTTTQPMPKAPNDLSGVWAKVEAQAITQGAADAQPRRKSTFELVGLKRHGAALFDLGDWGDLQAWAASLGQLERAPRLALPRQILRDGMDAVVASAIAAAIERLARAGADIVEIDMPELAEPAPVFERHGTLAAARAWQAWGPAMKERPIDFDPRVASRVRRGQTMSAADFITLQRFRADWAARFWARLGEFDALLAPTVPIVAPTVAELADEAAYFAANTLALRNASFINLADGCAISLPCHAPNTAPVGLMLAAPPFGDAALLHLAAWVEAALAIHSRP